MSLRLLLLVLLVAAPARAGTIWVTDLTDDLDTANGTCTLREALTAANTDAPADACPAGNGTDDIYFAKTGTINLIQALPAITKSVNLIGPRADLLTVDANGFGRVLHFQTEISQTFSLCGMTLTDGDGGARGGGIYLDTGNSTVSLMISDAVITDNEAETGGGIYSRGGNVTLTQSTVSGNRATVFEGGGLFAGSPGTLVIHNSTLSGNTSASGGGGLSSKVDATIRRSTFSGNQADGSGGGIVFSDVGGTAILDIRHTTITNNTAAADANLGDEGGLCMGAAGGLIMKNTIIAGNFDLDPTPLNRPDIGIPDVVPLTSFGYNFIGINTGASSKFPSGNPNVNDDYVGTAAAPLVAQLDPLGDYNGPTLTHQPGATAFELVDQGSCSEEPYDQRGIAGDQTTPFRPRDLATPNADDGCDIGAVEVAGNVVPPTFDLKVLLDGPYTNVLMHTDLNANGQVPLSQPYNTAPWGYGGGENVTTVPNDMVDWVLVEFQQGGPQDPGGFVTTHRRVFYVENNGDLTVPDGFFPFRVDPGKYYVTIDHRNHLGVLSAVPVTVKWAEALTYDFSTSLAQAYTAGGTAMRDVGGGFFTMWGGDGDVNGSVTAFDFLNTWLPINGGPLGYDAGDFDMNGSGTAFDFLTTWLPANGQASQVP